MSFIVAIDGPAGTGKGTITKLIAKDFGYTSPLWSAAALTALAVVIFFIADFDEKKSLKKVSLA